MHPGEREKINIKTIKTTILKMKRYNIFVTYLLINQIIPRLHSDY